MKQTDKEPDFNNVPVWFKFGEFVYKTTMPYDAISPRMYLVKPRGKTRVAREGDAPMPSVERMEFECVERNPHGATYEYVS